MTRAAANSGAAGLRKIVFVNRYFFPDQSATSRMLSDLAFRLARRGLSVAVVTSRQLYDDPLANLPANAVAEGVVIHRVATATRGRASLSGRALDYASFYAASGWKLLQILSRGDVVVAKTDPPLVSIPVSRAAAWKGAVLVNWLQDLFPEVMSALSPGSVPKWSDELLLAARDRSLRRAGRNIVLSEAMRQRLLRRGIDAARILTIPNWADTDSIVPRATRESTIRSSLGLEGRFVLGYSGNFGRAHEFETLLGAAKLLRTDPGIAFLMTGAGARAGSLQQAVQREGLTSFVFQDYQPPQMLSDSMAASDVHLVSLLPSLEGLIVPSKVYGILAAGRPTVFVGDLQGDVASLIRKHDCGIAVAVADSEGLARQLRSLRDDPSRLESMGRRARQLALEQFNGEQALAQWLEFLEPLTSAVRVGPGLRAAL
jgi:glycosyltransferase involved in cell wall biosynthesis